MKKRIGLLLLAILVLTSLLAGCGTDSEETGGTTDDGGVIKIGVFEPMTGVAAAGGEMTVEGIELANEAFPEVLGREVEIVVVDNKSDKVESANAVSNLID